MSQVFHHCATITRNNQTSCTHIYLLLVPMEMTTFEPLTLGLWGECCTTVLPLHGNDLAALTTFTFSWSQWQQADLSLRCLSLVLYRCATITCMIKQIKHHLFSPCVVVSGYIQTLDFEWTSQVLYLCATITRNDQASCTSIFFLLAPMEASKLEHLTLGWWCNCSTTTQQLLAKNIPAFSYFFSLQGPML
jgi:hypothetical protein